MRKVLNTLRKDYIRSVSRDRLDAAATALTMYKMKLRSEQSWKKRSLNRWKLML